MSVTITAKDVAALRARTGAGMGDCKKALEETGGDIEKAVDHLRSKGIAKAEKRAGRAASEGQIVTWVSDDATLGAMIELNSETDFVARNDEFVALATLVCRHIAEDTSLDGVAEVGTDHALLGKHWHHDKSMTLGEVVKAAAAKTGENVTLRRVARFTSTGAIGFYRHHNGKVSVLADIGGATGAAARALGNTVAEHVAAGVPTVAIAVRKEDVSPEIVEREKAIFVEQAKASGKPDAIVQKMVSGRVEKFYSEVTLLQQPWVRDDSKTVGQLVQETPGAEVKRFARFQMGEA
ncbi:MAG: translation elongation factor Ts [Gemmatimonadetes bacterium]|nr:translation elongation factor Ts [Gemmatimonadota bacterium]MBI3567148.1 translation elongation factor Ts [Gemmatimonadota bacterium]